MPRLSIVIPNPAFDSQVEDTLVSVLQNRPEYSEIIVVTNTPYADPYGLGREVRFLTSDAPDRLALINEGIRQASGEVVHLLLPGSKVTDGWTDRIWQHFADPTIGSVASALLHSEDASRLLAAGVSYAARGGRRLVGAEAPLDSQSMSRLSVVAPVLAAGFYRRDLLVALNGFDTSLGESLADIEFGLATRDLGFRSVCEGSSRVVLAKLGKSSPRSYVEARNCERLYRRHLGSSGKASWSHRLGVAAEAICGFPHPRMITRVLGRWSARHDERTRESFEARLQAAKTTLAEQSENPATIPIGRHSNRILSRRKLAA